MQFHTFHVKPGEAIDWHYHRGLAYVVIEHGTLSEQHLNGNGTCAAWETFGAGSAFVEQPGEVHRVANTGKSDAVVTWATAFPTADGVFPILPQFTVGGVYPPPNPRSCSREPRQSMSVPPALLSARRRNRPLTRGSQPEFGCLPSRPFAHTRYSRSSATL